MNIWLVVIPGGAWIHRFGTTETGAGGHSDTDHCQCAELSKSMSVTQRLVVMTNTGVVDHSEITCQEGLRGMLCEVVPPTPTGTYCIIWPPKVTSANVKITPSDLIYSKNRSTRMNVNMEALDINFLARKKKRGVRSFKTKRNKSALSL